MYRNVQFDYPELVKIFGLKPVQRASYLSPYKLRFLESSLALLVQHFDKSFHTDFELAELF